MLTLRNPLVRTLLIDGLIAAALTVLVLVGSVQAAKNFPLRHPLDGFAYTLVVIATVALAFRRVQPVTVLAVTIAVCTVYLALDYPYGPVLLTMVISMYTVSTKLPPRQSGIACLAGLLAVAVGEVRGFSQATRGEPVLVLLQVAWVGWAVMPWLLGLLVKYTQDAVQRSREEENGRRIYEERLRAAREVHDVVGHGLAVISLQAGVALHVLERRPDQAKVALEVIRRSSKDSLDELRTTLAVFRQQDGSAPRRPAPSLALIGTLIASMAGSGLAVELAVTGQPYDLPAAVDLAAYRIVQESLTNVLRHAGTAQAQVNVEYGERGLRIEVLDDGPGRAVADGSSPLPDIGGGLGIVGMKERAAGVGGTVEAGPSDDGGFRVLALLPGRKLGS